MPFGSFYHLRPVPLASETGLDQKSAFFSEVLCCCIPPLAPSFAFSYTLSFSLSPLIRSLTHFTHTTQCVSEKVKRRVNPNNALPVRAMKARMPTMIGPTQGLATSPAIIPMKNTPNHP